ncbi:imelysin family protein [Paracoccaceae bacterium Fryx2]|nr:imelysin family protein [Paracoccaceae bacterium Fryx2]
MKRVLLPAMITLCAATAVSADVNEVVSAQILPGFARFADAAMLLEAAARSDCRPAQVRPAFQTAFDAWTQVADMRIGPSETAALSIAFWPDDRGFTQRALSALTANEDPIARDPVAFADISIAARGLFALEMLLYDPAFSEYGLQDYTCELVRTAAADLSRQATDLERAWSDGFARTLITAGAADNATYLSGDEATGVLYTQILAGLQMMRISRRMGADFARSWARVSRHSGQSFHGIVGRLADAFMESGLNDLVKLFCDGGAPAQAFT